DANRISTRNNFNWKNVPNILWKDVGDEEINLVGRIGCLRAAAHCLNSIRRSRRLHSEDRFDLHAPKDLLEPDNHVIAGAVSPGLGDGEAHARGFAHEGQFSKFAKILTIE